MPSQSSNVYASKSDSTIRKLFDLSRSIVVRSIHGAIEVKIADRKFIVDKYRVSIQFGKKCLLSLQQARRRTKRGGVSLRFLITFTNKGISDFPPF